MKDEMLLNVMVKPVCIPYSSRRLGSIKLHVLQDQVYTMINKGRSIVLSAPTGSGKTLTLLLATDYGGAVGIYPNNTLLINQRNSINDIIIKYSHIGRCVGYYDSESHAFFEKCPEQVPDSPLIIYKINDESGVLDGYKHLALLTISGRTIEREEERPKREIVYSLIEKALQYKSPYIVALTTPDTFLLLYSGAYRDYETVGKLINNLLILFSSNSISSKKIEDELRRSMTAARSSLSPIIGIKSRMLEFPLFIDEFHLYGVYELDALYAILKLNKEVSIEEMPVVFSSATPARDSLETLKQLLGLEYEELKYESTGGCNGGFRVRGETSVDIVGVETGSHRWLYSYYHVGDYVSRILLQEYRGVINKHVKSGRKLLIILDRVYQVFQLVEDFIRNNLSPIQCYVSLLHPACSSAGNIIAGSQRITQGVNIENVSLLATTAIGVEDAIQRFGRSGRNGLKSHVILFAPKERLKEIEIYNNKILNYNNFINLILNKIYTNITSRGKDLTRKLQGLHRVRRKLIYSVAVASVARVMGQYRLLDKLRGELNEDTVRNILENWIYGDPLTFAEIIKFRRSGFKVKYRYRADGQDFFGIEDIGIIIRNARVKMVERDTLIIDPWNPPKSIKERHIVRLDPGNVREYNIKGKITRLKFLAKRHNAELILNNSILEPLSDTLLYVHHGRLPEFYLLTGDTLLVDFGPSSSTIAIYL